MEETNGECEENQLVFVCVDGSENSLRAFDWFSRHYYKPEQTIGLVHVHTASTGKHSHRRSTNNDFRNSSCHGNNDFRNSSCQEDAEDGTAIVQKFLSLSVQRGMKTKVFFKPREKSESVGHVICSLIKRNRPSFVVIGQRGLGLVQRTLYGSVSEYVLSHGHIPTLVVPPEKQVKDFKLSRSRSCAD